MARISLLALLTLWPSLAALCADDVGDPAAVRRLEASQEFAREVTLRAALASREAYRGKLLRVIGSVCGIVTRSTDQVAVTTVILTVEPEQTEMVDIAGRPMIAVGQQLRLIVALPEGGAARVRPVALAWADNSLFEDSPAAPDAHTPQTTATAITQPLAQPAQPPPLGTAQMVGAAPGSLADQLWEDRRRVFTRTAAPVQPAAMQTGPGLMQSYTPVYVPPEQELAQYQSYLQLVKYFNPQLTDFEVSLITQCLFRYCAAYGVPRPLAAAMVYAESRYDPLAKSPAGAMGLTQLMPKTAEALGVSSPYNIEQNMRGGIQYLAMQLAKYAQYPPDQQFQLALACYNAGPNAVVEHGGVPPYAETRNYIAQIAGLVNELYRLGYR